MNVVFDTETTGKFNYKAPVGDESQPHIVQLAAQLIDEVGKVRGEFNILIKPEGWTIPAETSEIHGILTEDCEKYGVPIRSALGLLNLWLGLNPLVIAHNIKFDMDMVDTEAIRLGRDRIIAPMRKYCTMEATTDIVKIPGKFGKNKWPKLIEAHEFLFNEGFDGAHDALVDVRACARVFFELRKRGIAPVAFVPESL